MAKAKKKWMFILSLLIFIIYLFVVPHSVPEEAILRSRWVTSLESSPEDQGPAAPGEDLVPFILGDRFGYVGVSGRFAINQIRNGYASLSENHWAEYETLPFAIQVMNPLNESVFVIEQPGGYPLFLDNRVFILGNEQNSITALGPNGEELWSYDFPAPLTTVDASGGYFLAGTLDGLVILLNSSGIPVFAPFEPGGSNLSVILGCAISEDASLLALISGIDEQRFLLMERSGDIYRVVYHEFLGTGFRRPVHISFINNSNKAAFEREGGLSIYNIITRRITNLNIEGEIVVLDNSGEGDFLFLITSQESNQKRLVTIRYPGFVVGEAPFKSENAFLERRDSRLYIGGDSLIALFELEKK